MAAKRRASIRLAQRPEMKRARIDLIKNPISEPKNAKLSQRSPSKQGATGRFKVFECSPIKDAVSVLEDPNGCQYSVILQYIDSAHNHHKFYAMQALQISGKQFGCLFWWGRIGSTGRSSLIKSKKREATINMFVSKFKSKTGLDWEDRSNEGVPGKYHVTQQAIHPDEVKVPKSPIIQPATSSQRVSPKSHLPVEMQELLRAITNRPRLAAEIRKIEPHYNNSDDMPLGNLTPAQLNQGYECLREIEKLMAEETPDQKLLAEVSDRFYSAIPYQYKASSTLPVINTSDQIRDIAGLLNLLADIQIALRRLEEAEAIEANGKINHLDVLYKSLGYKVDVVPSNSDNYYLIQEYLMMNHAPSHDYDLTLKAVFEVKNGSDEAKFKDLGNKMLLWHGSRIGAVFGVLSHGLQVAPVETPNDRFMFGRGLYFSDVSSESGKYCHARDKEEGVLMLAEVSLGEMNIKASPDSEAVNQTRGTDSTFGRGRREPECKNNGYKVLFNDVKVPIGPIKKVFARKGQLPLNEYTIYDQTQARLRFIVHVQFKMGKND